MVKICWFVFLLRGWSFWHRFWFAGPCPISQMRRQGGQCSVHPIVKRSCLIWQFLRFASDSVGHSQLILFFIEFSVVLEIGSDWSDILSLLIRMHLWLRIAPRFLICDSPCYWASSPLRIEATAWGKGPCRRSCKLQCWSLENCFTLKICRKSRSMCQPLPRKNIS